MNIYDSAKSQFTIPPSIISRPSPPTTDYTDSSDLIFNYESSPFSFWITRRSEPDAQPLFDTRVSSLPPTPIPPVIEGDASTALDGFPLVFEDQYLQLTSALPFGANIYGLGEVVASSGFRRDVGTGGGVGSIQTMWARDDADPIDQNMLVRLLVRASLTQLLNLYDLCNPSVVTVLIQSTWNIGSMGQQVAHSHMACSYSGTSDNFLNQ